MKKLGVLILAVGLLSLASAQMPVFIDTFENGVPVDSDSTPGFWTSMLPGTGTVIENGKLVQTADAVGNIRSTLFSPLSTNFNFFTRQLKFSADMDVGGTGDGTAWQNKGQFVLASASTNGFASPDTLMVGFRGHDSSYSLLSFDRKLSAPSVQPDDGAATSLIGTVGASSDNTYWFDRFDLTLNADRYQLKVYHAGKGSGILRFTGEHGILREDWGANGDSALLLETYRKSAEAGTVATSFWDNVSVETDATRLLDESFYDFQASYSTSYSSVTSDYRLWLPSTEAVIRGVIFIGPGDVEDFRYMVHDLAAQEAARSIGFALLAYEEGGRMNLGTGNSSLVKSAVQAVLDAAAAVSGRPEISNAPLCITGHSRGAFNSCDLAMDWPERLISFVAHRGGFYRQALSGATKKVPGLIVAGSKDTNPIVNPFRLQEDVFLKWRKEGAQIAFAADWGVRHTPCGNQGWEGGFTWLVEVANLRYPRPLVPSLESGAGWPELLDLADDFGWLGDRTEFTSADPNTPSVSSPFTAIKPYSDYDGALTNASWLPNETCARMYRTLTSTDLSPRTVIPLQTPLRITSPAQFADAVVVNQPVSIELDPREFDDTNAISEVQFYDGETLLGADTTGPSWSLSFTPTNEGLHTLSLVATDTQGARGTAFRTLSVMPVELITWPLPTEGNVITNGDFESGLDGWTVDVGAGTGTITADASAQSSFSAGTQGLKFIDDGDTGWNPTLLTEFANQTDGKYLLSFDFQQAALINNSWSFFLQTDGAADVGFKFRLRHRYLEIGAANTQVYSSIVAGNWYHVEMILDSETDQFVSGLITDGVTTNSWDTPIAANASSGEFNQMFVTDLNAGLNTDLLLDNVALSRKLPLPAAPSLSDILSSGGGLYVPWGASEFATGYRVERRLWTNSFVQVVSNQTFTYYLDTDITADSGYEYRVQAFNSSGNSPWSAGKRAIYSFGSSMAADDDGDGISNGQEYLARTDSADFNDGLVVEANINGSAPFILQWPARGGVRYRVQYSDDLLSGWTDIVRSVEEETQSGDDGDPGIASFTDDWTLTPPPAGNHRFYSIRVL